MTKRILIVDDDRGMVTTLSDILELRGWETINAFDGEAAIALAETHDVDVVLMDVRMPKVDGVEALRAIKARRPDTRVVLMTAFAAQELLAEAERAGVVSIMRKPVELPELFGLLEEATRRHRRSVLVVDDDPAFLETVCDVLTDRGLEAVAAHSLGEALDRMEKDVPSAVLLDLRLDHLDPTTNLLAIRELSPSILLILYSGHPTALSETVDRAPPGIVDAAFTKPLPLDQLLELLDGDHGR